MTHPPEISDEEIRKSMNFDQVLAMAVLTKQKKMRLFRNGLFLAGAVLLSGGAYFAFQYRTDEPPTVNQPLPLSPVQPQVDSASYLLPEPSTVPSKKQSEKPTRSAQAPKTKSQPTADSAASAYVPAEPVDGYGLLYAYFGRELNYPKEGIKDSIQGVVTVTFIIDKNGAPMELKTVNSLGPAFDRESIRVIEHMPMWKPAMLNGMPVESRISIPLTFQIKTLKQSR